MITKKQLFFFLIINLSLNSYSQISFEKGYFINNSGNKIECLIKNNDWRKNPIEFNYKVSEISEQQTANIEFIEEFGIYDVSKYKRHTVDIDRSRETISEISNNRSPVFKKETLFLKVLVEGKADLYIYEDVNLKRYFYKTNERSIEQLIFKSYLTNDGEMAKNYTFKYQLRENLKCPDISLMDTQNVDYETNELVKFFIKYNNCSNSEFINYTTKQKRDLYNLNIRPGINSSSLLIRGQTGKSKDVDFENQISFRIGIENELILPFNKNKWAIIVEPTYQYFKSESKTTSFGNIQNVKIDYKSLEIPIGVRHYVFLNENNKLFVNTSIILDFNFSTYVDYEFNSDLTTSNSSSNFAIGVGYKNNKNYSLEMRYYSTRNLNDKGSYGIKYNTLSLIFGYSLF